MDKIDFEYLHKLQSEYEDLGLFEELGDNLSHKRNRINNKAFEFIKANKKDIIYYFIDSITELEVNINSISDHYYNDEINKINNESIPEELELRIAKFHRLISKSYRKDSSLYRKTTDYNVINKTTNHLFYLRLGILLYRELNNKFPFIKRIEEIISFKYSTELSFIYQSLYLKLKNEKSNIKVKPTLTQYALFYYYTQASRETSLFENHPEGKEQAIKELILYNKIPTKSFKSFQLPYNKISNYPSNRIAVKQRKNIKFVIDNMLEKFPKAKNIAIEEYELTLTKSR